MYPQKIHDENFQVQLKKVKIFQFSSIPVSLWGNFLTACFGLNLFACNMSYMFGKFMFHRGVPVLGPVLVIFSYLILVHSTRRQKFDGKLHLHFYII